MPAPNLAPKARFLEQKAQVDSIRNVVVSKDFQTAADAALLHLVNDVASSQRSPDLAAAAFHVICGAVKYRTALQTIGDVATPTPQKRDSDNLSHV